MSTAFSNARKNDSEGEGVFDFMQSLKAQGAEAAQEAQKQPDGGVMGYIRQDLAAIAGYIDSLSIKTVMVGGFDKIDVYKNMQELSGKYNELIDTKIGGLFARNNEIIQSLSLQNKQLSDQLAARPPQQAQQRVFVQDTSFIQQESRRLGAELEQMRAEYQKLGGEMNLYKQRNAELEAALMEAQNAQPLNRISGDRAARETDMILREARAVGDGIVEEARKKAELQAARIIDAANAKIEGLQGETDRLTVRNNYLASSIDENTRKLTKVSDYIQELRGMLDDGAMDAAPAAPTQAAQAGQSAPDGKIVTMVTPQFQRPSFGRWEAASLPDDIPEWSVPADDGKHSVSLNSMAGV
ncbi:MAG: hypothetical protein FWF44_02155 [Defluviitaleaceae bacterium]|nr:hypothetical protein [Defluviitaleaceae bacterium]